MGGEREAGGVVGQQLVLRTCGLPMHLHWEMRLLSGGPSTSPIYLHSGQELPGPTWLHFVSLGLHSLHWLWQSEVSEKVSWWLLTSSGMSHPCNQEPG